MLADAQAASASRDAAASLAGPVKRGRGRPSKASIAAAAAATRDSTSSVPNSNYSESVSDYSTPLTSNVPTPAPEKPSARSAKFEVIIPAVSKTSKTSGSTAMAIQKAKDYIMGNDSKRKRQFIEIADSEDDGTSDPSPNARRTRHDEDVARQLQEELDREAAEALVHGSEEDAFLGGMDEDSDEAPLADSKGKGKAVARRSRSGRSTAKAIVLGSSEDDDDFYEPPTKKQKTKGKGKDKGKMPDIGLSDDDSDSDEALAQQRKSKGKGKGKMPISTLSDDDDNVHSKLIPLPLHPLFSLKTRLLVSTFHCRVSFEMASFTMTCFENVPLG